MKLKINREFHLVWIVIVLSTIPALAQRNVSNLNQDWKFILEDNIGFSASDFQANDWEMLNIPHDWAFQNGIRREGTQKQGGGYHDGGVGWYRKTVQVNKKALEKVVYLEFDGVYMNSEVWINGNSLGKRPYGYISFRYDISKYLKKGDNSIAIRVDNTLEPSARWYHPCGIYAPVRLIEVNPMHIAPNGIFITTPEINDTQASVVAEVKWSSVEMTNKDLQLKASVVGPNGKVLQTTTQAVKDLNAPQNIGMTVNQPQRWSPETPVLYKLVTELRQGNKAIDKVETNFGFRTIRWETETGFWLNDKNIKLKGVCEHWEGGPVAGAWTKPLLRWKLQLLKDMGINAIRPSHNPVPPMFYDICDEIGLLVMDEIFDGWHRKAPFDYGAQAFDDWWQRDVTEWIERDRNHPSIFIYSLGNETHSDIAPTLVAFCQKLDPTRLITSGSGNTDDMPVAGVNGGSEYQSFLENRRYDKPFISTEAPHTWQTRGYYRTQTWFRDNQLKNTYPLPSLTEKEIFFYDWADPKIWKNRKQHFNSSYDNATVRISARKNWEVMRDTPWHSGHFRWTGFDYYGESNLAHGGWPFNLFMGGAVDVAGFEKDLYRFYQSQWTEEPMVHILPHWTHSRMEKGTVIPVWVYSNADEVGLFLNGRSLGKDQPGTVWNEMQCEWMVPYEEGKLEAVAYENGKEIARTHFQTASQPIQLKNTLKKLPAEAHFEANYLLTSDGVDRQGNLFPYGENRVYYAVKGDLEKVSLENGNPTDQTSRAKANFRSLFMGKTRAILQAKAKAKKGSVVIASILGDKSLFLANTIAIDAQEIFLIGKAKKRDFEIRYTTNGDDPALAGMLYQGPFEITNGTTVKAIVKQKNKILLNMEETFGADQGLFWGDEHSEDVWIGRGITVPAEDAQLSGSAKASSNARRYKSDGFVDFQNQEGAITWYKENDGEPGEYDIRIRYTHNDPSSQRPMTLTVNGEVIQTFEFKSTGSWETDWKFVRAKINLKPGANQIELKTTGQSAPHIDELFID